MGDKHITSTQHNGIGSLQNLEAQTKTFVQENLSKNSPQFS